MAFIPQTTHEYRLPKADGFHNLTIVEAPIPKLKSTEVLIKIHAVSLQVSVYTLIIIAALLLLIYARFH